MLDPKIIRNNPEAVREALAKKGDTGPLDEFLSLDEKRRLLIQETETLKSQRNSVSDEIAHLKQKKEPAEEKILQMREVSGKIKQLDEELRELEPRLEHVLLTIPNLPSSKVPYGKTDADNELFSTWGEPRKFEFEPKPHWEIGEKLGILDCERGVKLSGARFYVLKGLGCSLERALISWFIDVHTHDQDYTEVATPYLVKPDCMVGTGQLPKFAEDMYHVDSDDLYLIPTAEVPVTNMYRDEILEGDQLPIALTCYSASFRREAGSAGKDTRGVIRVHQFDKVEMVRFVKPEDSYNELEKLRGHAVELLQRLGLPYQVHLLCTGDMSFTSAITYDPEVWMPGTGRYVEISSCSNFESYQARRANIRFRRDKKSKPEFVHTLNGSGLAVGRTWAAILENYQEEDGSVVIPEVLRPYMGGLEKITSQS